MSYVGCPYIFMDADITPDSAIEEIRMNLIQGFGCLVVEMLSCLIVELLICLLTVVTALKGRINSAQCGAKRSVGKTGCTPIRGPSAHCPRPKDERRSVRKICSFLPNKPA